jgi:hypothetical protein
LKYNISKISKIEQIEYIYNDFIKFSPQKNIFCSEDILKFFFDDLDLFTINKNDKIKSFIYLLKNKDSEIISEPLIYSGIINHPQLEMKLARYNNEVFKINEIIINEIISKYSKANFNLPLDFLDTRPFLWFNYRKKDKNFFLVSPRYTSIININSKNKDEIFSEIDDVKKRDIKNALKNRKYRVSAEINLDLIKDFYIKTMKKNEGTFNKNSFNKIFNFIKTQIDKTKIIQSTTFYDEKPIYSVLFLTDETSSCYLYGSGNVNIKDRYAGSLSLWKAIDQSINKRLNYIDLEGINSPFRGEFKINFGGKIKQYFNISF